jgi:oxygen-independent coproporphyrinogen-3 oxidase
MYWQRKPYKGFGLGACSFDGMYRTQNQKNLMKYLNAIERDGDHIFFSETLTKEQIFLERMMLGLRRTKGICIDDLIVELSDVQKEKINSSLARLQEQNFLKNQQGWVSLTSAGLAVQNEIIVQLTL